MDDAFEEKKIWGVLHETFRNSTDALISYARVANIALGIVTVKILLCFVMVGAILSHVMRRYD